MQYSIFVFFIFMFSSMVKLESSKIVIEVLRHGARNPIENIEPFEVKKSREYLSDLTPVGIKEHFNLGRLIQKKYKHFITTGLSSSEMALFSSDKKRSIMSLQAHLQGIFFKTHRPTTENQDITSLWSPPSVQDLGNYKQIHKTAAIPSRSIFPLDIQNKEQDFLFLAHHICPKTKLQMEEFDQNNEDLISIFNPTDTLLKQNGFNVKEMFPGKPRLYNYIKVCSFIISDIWSENKNQINFNLLAQCMILEHVFLSSLYDNDQLLEVALNKMFSKIKQNLEHFQHGLKFKKLMIFSGHDDNLNAIILRLLNKNNIQCTISNYQNIIKQNIQDINQFQQIIQSLNSNNCFTTTPFASNLIFEVFEGIVINYFR